MFLSDEDFHLIVGAYSQAHSSCPFGTNTVVATDGSWLLYSAFRVPHSDTRPPYFPTGVTSNFIPSRCWSPFGSLNTGSLRPIGLSGCIENLIRLRC